MIDKRLEKIVAVTERAVLGAAMTGAAIAMELAMKRRLRGRATAAPAGAPPEDAAGGRSAPEK